VRGGDDIGELSMSTPPRERNAPLADAAGLREEVSNARIWGGFHYRFSTEVGRDMGKENSASSRSPRKLRPRTKRLSDPLTSC
jgi:hypothetical protein